MYYLPIFTLYWYFLSRKYQSMNMNEPNGQNDVESGGSITLNMNRNGKYQTSLNYTVGG